MTASTPADRSTLYDKVDFGGVGNDDEYSDNIQIAELNSLNAGLAVLWWKRHFGMYRQTRPHHHQHLNAHFGRLYSE